MRLRVRCDGDEPRRWLVRLLERIERLPDVVIEVERGAAGGSLPQAADLLFRVEAVFGRQPRSGGSARAEAGALARYAKPSAAAPDLVLDLCGDGPERPGLRVWSVTFDGRSGETALLASCLAGRSPVVAIREAGEVVASGRVGTESRGNLLASFEDALARTATLVLAALTGARPRLPDGACTVAGPSAPRPSAPLPAARLAARAVRAPGAAVGRRLRRLAYRTPHWRVGWRRLDGPDLVDRRAHPDTGWHDLPDDGHRFYADPFPIDHEGATILFVEEYVHARAKAHISAVAFGPDGPLGTPVPVLDEPHHLSYPFVFARDGAVWMVPESCANGTVDLYRATAFPGGWVRHATLLSGLVAGDATLLEHEGRWWMFATLRDAVSDEPDQLARGSYSDALHLWSAPDFRGPWIPHAGNPVLIDIASARPAGRIVARGGALVRPVQDCRLGYGEALSLARIDRLDDGGYAQTVETTLRAGPAWAGTCLHTLNRSRDFEFIDGSGRAPRFGPTRR